jgi:hypothetical protein
MGGHARLAPTEYRLQNTTQFFTREILTARLRRPHASALQEPTSWRRKPSSPFRKNARLVPFAEVVAPPRSLAPVDVSFRRQTGPRAPPVRVLNHAQWRRYLLQVTDASTYTEADAVDYPAVTTGHPLSTSAKSHQRTSRAPAEGRTALVRFQIATGPSSAAHGSPARDPKHCNHHEQIQHGPDGSCELHPGRFAAYLVGRITAATG